MTENYNLWAFPKPFRTGPVLSVLHDAGDRLAAKLTRIDPSKLKVSEQFRRSVAELRRGIDATLAKYIHLLAWGLHPCGPTKETALIDYGGGHGLMGCLAREAGM